MQSLKQFDNNYEDHSNSYFDFDDQYWWSWLESEGFEHITNKTEDSYGFLERYPDERYNAFLRNDYWYWCKCFKHFMIRIYVFRNCVVIDKDWDFGGNAGGRVFDHTEIPFDIIWDDVIEYIKFSIQ